MQPSVEQQVENYRRASEELRREIEGNPAKARAFLESAGILKPLPAEPDAEPQHDAAEPRR